MDSQKELEVNIDVSAQIELCHNNYLPWDTLSIFVQGSRRRAKTDDFGNEGIQGWPLQTGVLAHGGVASIALRMKHQEDLLPPVPRRRWFRPSQTLPLCMGWPLAYGHAAVSCNPLLWPHWSLQRHAKTMTIAIVIEDLHILPSQENKTTGSSNAEVNSDVASFSEPSFVQDGQVMRCGDAQRVTVLFVDFSLSHFVTNNLAPRCRVRLLPPLMMTRGMDHTSSPFEHNFGDFKDSGL